jgi:hydrogenase maturation factor
MSVVQDARIAVSVGVRDEGVSSMHDATECGIWGGIFEVARAANLGARVEKEKIVAEECVHEICGLFRIDPYISISEGTLIITCREHKAEPLIGALAREGIKASICGEMVDLKKGMTLVADGREQKLEHPIVDPFWKAFYDALQDYKKLEV